MAKLIAGVIIGFIMCADVGMVAFCVWYERRYPSALEREYFYKDSGRVSKLPGEE